MKNIAVTDEVYESLMEISRNMNKQDNRCTPSPYIFQILHKEEKVAYEGCGSDIVFVNDEGEELRAMDDIDQYIIELLVEGICFIVGDEAVEAAEHEISDWDFFRKTEFLYEHGWKEVEITKGEVFDNCFFTEEACKKYIKRHSKDYDSPESYITGISGNEEMKTVIDFLSNLSK